MEKSHPIALTANLHDELVEHYELIPEDTFVLIKDTVIKAWNSGRLEALREPASD